jgi:hypothetical protein
MKRSRIGLKLLIAANSALVGLFLVEFVLVCLAPRSELDARAEVAHELGTEFDARTRLEVVEDLRKDGVDAWPTMKPYLMLPEKQRHRGGETDLEQNAAGDAFSFPLGGISESTSVYCNEGGAYAVFETDEHGFRNPLGSHRDGWAEAVIVGDSFGNGACVQTGEDPAASLSSRGLSTLSLASPGNGPLIELATLVEYAAPLRPPIVLWLYFEGNDLKNLSDETRSSLLRRYLDGDFSQELRTKQREVDDRLREFSKKWEVAARAKDERSGLRHLSAFVTLYHVRTLLGWTSSHPDYEASADMFCRVIEHAEETVGAWGGRMVFVYLPSWHRYIPGRDAEGLRMRAEIQECVERRDIPFVDFDRVVSSSDDPLGFFSLGINPHYNEFGYRRLADMILSNLHDERP